MAGPRPAALRQDAGGIDEQIVVLVAADHGVHRVAGGAGDTETTIRSWPIIVVSSIAGTRGQ